MRTGTDRAAAAVVWVLALLTGSAGAWAQAPASEPGISYRVVAVNGEQAGGLPSGADYWFVDGESPRLNDNGRVSFISSLIGTGVTFQSAFAVFSDAEGAGPSSLYRAGDPVPGLSADTRMVTLTRPVVTESGQHALMVTFNGPGVTDDNNRVLLRGGINEPTSVLMRMGEQAPGMAPGVTLESIGAFSERQQLSESGRFLVGARVNNTAFGDRISVVLTDHWGNGFEPVVTEYDRAAGMSTDLFVTSWDSPRVNELGTVVLRGTIDGSGVGTGNRGIFRNQGSGLELVARKNDQAPGLPAGVQYDLLFDAHVNNNDTIAFTSQLRGAGITPENRYAIFSSREGHGITAVLRTGGQAPGFPAGVTLTGVGSLGINDRDDMVFRANVDSPALSGPISHVLYRAIDGQGYERIATPGEQAPGLDAGVLYAAVGDEPLINDSAQLAFSATLTDGTSGLFAADVDGSVSLIAAVGQELNLSRTPGVDDFRTVIALSPEFELNNAGQIVFTATFDASTSAIFVATIPAPGSVLVLVAVCAHTRRRRA